MKLPPFTLIHNRGSVKGAGSRRAAPDLPAGVKKNLQATLAASFGSGALSTAALGKVAKEMKRQERVETVGIWDLGAWVGNLPKIVEALNAAQPAIVIFEVQAAIPAGLVSQPDHVILWGEEKLGRTLADEERSEQSEAIIDEEFFPRAEVVRKDLGVDYLVGLSGARIAGVVDDEEGHVVHSDFFSSTEGRVCLASTFGLRELAAKAGCPFESAVAYVFLGSLFTAMNSDVEFHEDRGCLLDYNYDRSTIINGLRDPKLDTDCRGHIRPAYRGMAESLVKTLRKYSESQAIL